MHRFVHHHTQFKLNALCHRQPMQPITNQAGDVRVFSCTAKHPTGLLVRFRYATCRLLFFWRLTTKCGMVTHGEGVVRGKPRPYLRGKAPSGLTRKVGIVLFEGGVCFREGGSATPLHVKYVARFVNDSWVSCQSERHRSAKSVTHAQAVIFHDLQNSVEFKNVVAAEL